MTSKTWIMQVPVLSTSHITKQTNELLTRQGDDNPWMHCAKYDQGYFISVPAASEFPSDVMAAPADLVEIWDWAREHNYAFVRVDVDGSICPDLTEYDW